MECSTPRWMTVVPGSVVMKQPLIKEVDFEGIPEHLYKLWYFWQIQLPCGLCGLPTSAYDAMVFDNDCNGKAHRPATLAVENGFAVVPQEFIDKMAGEICEHRVTESMCVDSFEEAHQPLVLRGPFNPQVVYPSDIAVTHDIPQPPRPVEVSASLSNMMQYIVNLGEKRAVEDTVNPWQTIRFLPLFSRTAKGARY